MTRVLAVLVFLELYAAARVCAQEPLLPLAAKTIAEFEGVDLSAEQVAHIKQLAAEYGPQISQAESSAERTPAQRSASDEAIKKAIAECKKGIEAHKILATAGSLTQDQKRAARKAMELRREFESSVFAPLAEEQKAKLKSGAGIKRRVNGDPHRGSGWICVQLSPHLRDTSDQSQTLSDVAIELGLAGLQKVLDDFKLNVSRRVVPNISPADIQVLRESPTKATPLRRLWSSWRIDVRENQASIEEMLNSLRKLPGIEWAYIESDFSSPAIDTSNDEFNGQQHYLDPAPDGVDARFAWGQENGRGAGVTFVDLETGWNVDHEDFMSKTPQKVFGDLSLEYAGHGTAVLGEVMAADNKVGVVGIAPSVDAVFLTSHFDAATNTNSNIAAAIYGAVQFMNEGDVLLLEAEVTERRLGECLLPVEVDPVVFDAIRFAVENGAIVVEPAGNGGLDLDNYENVLGKKILNIHSTDFRPSGAIMVGAADSAAMHDRIPSSNFGSRVDCFGWGRNVVTTGFHGDLHDGGGDPNKQYTECFNGTSSAAPIVAGAAIILQGIAKANSNFGLPVSPGDMRNFLANPMTGTPQGTTVPGHIGVMPNLRAIIEHDVRFHP